MNATNEKKTMTDGFAMVILLSAALVAIGALFLVYREALRFETISQAAGGIVIAAGIFLIIRYIYRQEYRNVTNFDLAIGLIDASAGVCIIVNAQKLSAYYIPFIGILTLLEAVVMIQFALAIRIMDGKLYPLAALMATGVYAFAMLSIIDPFDYFEYNKPLFFALVSLSGIFGLFSMFLAWMRGRDLKREEDRDAQRIMEDEPVVMEDEPESEEDEPVVMEYNDTQETFGDEEAAAFPGETVTEEALPENTDL